MEWKYVLIVCQTLKQNISYYSYFFKNNYVISKRYILKKILQIKFNFTGKEYKNYTI